MYAVVRHISVAAFCVGVTAGLVGCNAAGGASGHRSWTGDAVASPQTDTHLVGKANSVDMSVVDVQEVDLVEALVNHRTRYHRLLTQLHDYYASRGDVTKQHWAAFERQGLRNVQTFRYLLDAEVASDALKPLESIAEADRLFEEGNELMRRGGHKVPALYRQDRMIEAARKFRELIERYPTSDKIDDAAFLCGEIHKEYLPGQELIAVKWYERAFTWNADTPHPARFEAAVVYDYRLHDRDRALELYQEALQRESTYTSNVRFATRRIRELTGGVQPVPASGTRPR